MTGTPAGEVTTRLRAVTAVRGTDAEQLLRLQRIRRRYPRVTISWDDGWQARLPEHRAEHLLCSASLADLLRQIEAINPDKLLAGSIIRYRIAAGEYTGKIPAAPDLAEEFGVTPFTVYEACCALVREGLLCGHQGRGYYVTAPQMPADSDPLAWQRVLGDLLTQIETGRLKPDDELPPNQILGAPHGCGYDQVMTALKELERRGTIGRSRPHAPYRVLSLTGSSPRPGGPAQQPGPRPDQPVHNPHAHPAAPLLPACPMGHLHAYGLNPQIYHALKQQLGDSITAGDLAGRCTAGTLTSIQGIGKVRVAELQRALTSAGLVPATRRKGQ
jgi:DNA-binding transcriptional regulator YhcF (GntR family)